MISGRLLTAIATSAALFAAPASAQQQISWSDSIASLGLATTPGTSYSFTCSDYGTAAIVWGSMSYTHDSSICTAAAHAGEITFTAGGVVSLTMVAGQQSYTGSIANGVETFDYGAWNAGFGFGAVVNAPDGAIATIGLQDSLASLGLQGRTGEVVTFLCPAGGDLSGPVWGSEIYTDDSAICKAAVHAGRISAAAGGFVTLEIMPGQASYPSSAANGVTTSSYGAWSGSYRFVGK